jgi:quercetin dioxygenase-like cupin family protein
MHWSDQDFTEVRPGIFGATVDSEQLTTTIYRYEPGCEWETHSHPEDQMTFVTEGGPIDFVVGGSPVSLSAGEFSVIPGDVPHSASVRADAPRVITVNVWRLRTKTP